MAVDTSAQELRMNQILQNTWQRELDAHQTLIPGAMM